MPNPKPIQTIDRYALGCMALTTAFLLSACHQKDAPPAGLFTQNQYPMVLECDVERKETTSEGKALTSKQAERFTLSQQTRANVIGPNKSWIHYSDVEGVEGDVPAQQVWVLVREGADELTERRVHHKLWDGQLINEYTTIDVNESFIKLKNSVGYPRTQKDRETDVLVISRVDGSIVERWWISSPDGKASYEDTGMCYPPGQKPKPKPQENSEHKEAGAEGAVDADIKPNAANIEIDKTDSQQAASEALSHTGAAGEKATSDHTQKTDTAEKPTAKKHE